MVMRLRWHFNPRHAQRTQVRIWSDLSAQEQQHLPLLIPIKSLPIYPSKLENAQIQTWKSTRTNMHTRDQTYGRPSIPCSTPSTMIKVVCMKLRWVSSVFSTVNCSKLKSLSYDAQSHELIFNKFHILPPLKWKLRLWARTRKRKSHTQSWARSKNLARRIEKINKKYVHIDPSRILVLNTFFGWLVTDSRSISIRRLYVGTMFIGARP